MGKTTNSMAIFNSYVSLPEGSSPPDFSVLLLVSTPEVTKSRCSIGEYHPYDLYFGGWVHNEHGFKTLELTYLFHLSQRFSTSVQHLSTVADMFQHELYVGNTTWHRTIAIIWFLGCIYIYIDKIWQVYIDKWGKTTFLLFGFKQFFNPLWWLPLFWMSDVQTGYGSPLFRMCSVSK